MDDKRYPKIVIIGAGFGGLLAAQALAKKPVDVVLIDRQNFHTFTPLLYQVATCGLDGEQIAYPVRGIFRGARNVRFLMGEVTCIDYEAQRVDVRTNGQTRQESYDYLIVAAGSVAAYFGSADLKQHAFVLKSLNDALRIRQHILKSFEKAVWTNDPAYEAALTTLVVVGGGPTGLETAGALYELYNDVLRREFAEPRKLKARVLLIEASDTLLRPYPEYLREAALEQLQSLGVEVVLNEKVTEVRADHVRLSSGRVINTHTLIWSAGVEASPLAKMLAVPLQQAGRVPVKPTLEVIGRDTIYVVGDMAYLEDDKGQAYPMVIPVANQQGTLAARNILRRAQGRAEQEFRYSDKGIMATIGRTRAVAWLFNRFQLTGFVAWAVWLAFHLVTLMGFRKRINVFINWVWNYFVFPLPDAYGHRMILPTPEPRTAENVPASTAEAAIVSETAPSAQSGRR
ncbi:MAG: NAD(P)/FAD-dependent oxidoreductase [Chloroflexi bacterium]|nr:NAD(P)/FAD-dependent oxidoreductase [Chloroflexota bacterium]